MTSSSTSSSSSPSSSSSSSSSSPTSAKSKSASAASSTASSLPSSDNMPSLRIEDLFNVKGQHVLITGGGKGIGLMLTTAFVQNGAHVYICSRDAASIEVVARKLTALGSGTCQAFSADLNTIKGIDIIVTTLKAMGVNKLDTLINNSGASWGQPLAQFTEQGWNKVMDLNVKSLFFLTKALVPLLQAASTASKPAHIINIGSVVGLHHQNPETYSYDASKAAVHSLTKKLAEKLAPQITVNALAPGFVLTKMSKGLPTSVDEISKHLPMARTGNASDMSGTALFLASPCASWITGQIIAVDGGLLAMSRM